MTPDHIIELSNSYHRYALIFLVVAVVCLIAAVSLWFLFDIPHVFIMLTGYRPRKALQTKREPSGKKAIVSWGASARLGGRTVTGTLSEVPQETPEEIVATTTVLKPERMTVKKRVMYVSSEEEL